MFSGYFVVYGFVLLFSFIFRFLSYAAMGKNISSNYILCFFCRLVKVMLKCLVFLTYGCIFTM